MIIYDKIIDINNLEEAFNKAKKGKRHKRNYLEFSKELGYNITRLEYELKNRIYEPKDCFVFKRKENRKERVITAPHFRDLIVQHAIYNKLKPFYFPKFSKYSYACIDGRGTHAAMLQSFNYHKNYKYVLKLDIKKFFPNVDIGILFDLLSKKIKDSGVLGLCKLFYKNEKGMPIGFLLSQIFANIYLDRIDKFIERNNYSFIRYMDDIFIYSNCIKMLKDFIIDIEESLFLLELELRKWSLEPTVKSFTSIGYIFKDKQILLKQKSIQTLKRNKDVKGHCKYVSTYHLLKLE